MTRKNNTGDGWHVDHHISINYFKKNFNFMNLEVQKKCFHYTNLQPLWASDNISKGVLDSKVPESGTDEEFLMLNKNFNNMIQRLKKQQLPLPN